MARIAQCVLLLSILVTIQSVEAASTDRFSKESVRNVIDNAKKLQTKDNVDSIPKKNDVSKLKLKSLRRSIATRDGKSANKYRSLINERHSNACENCYDQAGSHVLDSNTNNPAGVPGGGGHGH